MKPVHLYTIGFTQKTAEDFFRLLQQNEVNVLVDIRLKPDSQLSAFARARDLPYFLKRLIGCDYRHLLEMAPNAEILTAYREDKDWAEYEKGFGDLLNQRNLIAQLDRDWWADHKACLLCSEHEPDHCHRRIVAEYLAGHWPDVEIHHLI